MRWVWGRGKKLHVGVKWVLHVKKAWDATCDTWLCECSNKHMTSCDQCDQVKIKPHDKYKLCGKSHVVGKKKKTWKGVRQHGKCLKSTCDYSYTNLMELSFKGVKKYILYVILSVICDKKIIAIWGGTKKKITITYYSRDMYMWI